MLEGVLEEDCGSLLRTVERLEVVNDRMNEEVEKGKREVKMVEGANARLRVELGRVEMELERMKEECF